MTKTTERTPQSLVRDVLQRVYGDATQTVLDRQAANEIILALRDAGWASLEDVARLIEAAGGEITVPYRILSDIRERVVTQQDDYAAMGIKYRVTVSDR